MVLEKKPFRIYSEDPKRDTISVSLNPSEREILDRSKALIEQPKDSTALKQLAWIAAKAIHREEMSYLINTLFKNRKKNRRMGIVEFEDL